MALADEALSFFRAGGSLPSFMEWLDLDHEAQAALVAARAEWEQERADLLAEAILARLGAAVDEAKRSQVLREAAKAAHGGVDGA